MGKDREKDLEIREERKLELLEFGKSFVEYLTAASGAFTFVSAVVPLIVERTSVGEFFIPAGLVSLVGILAISVIDKKIKDIEGNL